MWIVRRVAVSSSASEEVPEFWESEAPPPTSPPTPESVTELNDLYGREMGKLHQASFLSEDEIRDIQLSRIKQLVGLAWREVPFYQKKYSAVGFEPGDLNSWDDFKRLPLVTKQELQEAGL